MKRLKYNFPLKVTLFFVSLIIIAATVLSSFAVGVMVFGDFYSRPIAAIRDDAMKNLAWREIYKSSESFIDGYADDYYSDKNVLYYVTDLENNLIGTNSENFFNVDSLAEVSEEFEYTRYYNSDGSNSYDYYNKKKNDNYYVDDEIVFRKDLEYIVTLKIPAEMEFTDRFYITKNIVDLGYSLRYTLIFIAVIGLIFSIAVVIFLFSAAGCKKEVEGVYLNFLDKLPIEINAAIVALVLIFSHCIGFDIYYPDIFEIIIICALTVPCYYAVLGLLLSVAVRIKSGTLIKNSIVYKTLRFIGKGINKFKNLVLYILKNIPSFWKVAIILAVFLLAELIALISFCYRPDVLAILWVIRSLWFICAVSLVAAGFYRLKKGTEQIAKGNLDAKINTEYLFDDLKSFGESINSINDGLQYALEDKMKSERMKTELITNVSHDIKTPLTSIINYVDLIKKEDIKDEKLNEYVDVLDRQSTRLKKLIEDLVEASKASTGNLSVELSECDASVLLTQIAGEYSEKLENNGLGLVMNIPESGARIMADGRRLWRVLDNLMNNICKYAQNQTRVYIDLINNGGEVKIIFKNISKYPLNISGEELTERFVRGDRSRNTEGSGLGLSIAKNLAELQGGSLDIIIDGDLFKVVIGFKAVGR